MRAAEHRRQLDIALLAWRDLWHPQPFREARPVWCEQWPALTAALLALSDAEAAHLNDDVTDALCWLAGYLPDIDALLPLIEISAAEHAPPPVPGERWAWEIPGRKRSQIEAFAGAVKPGGEGVIDWCGGKGHLGRLLGLAWQQPVHTLEIDAALCADGEHLARRIGLDHRFLERDALAVTASPRLTRQRDHDIAWKLAFTEWRAQASDAPYKTFKPVPAPWLRGSFADFLACMAAREGLPAPEQRHLEAIEAAGWQRQREVMRLSIPRHACRRSLELWLVLDLAECLEARGYAPSLATFCDRQLTPRNLLLTARRV